MKKTCYKYLTLISVYWLRYAIISLCNLALILFIVSCENRSTNSISDPTTEKYNYSVPDSTDDGWKVAHLDSVGIDHLLIERLVDSISINTMPDLHSIVIIKNGFLVFEEYFNGWHRDSLHMLMSCTKSFTSALTGIAIDEGLIQSLDTKLFDYFPEYIHLQTPRKDSILLRHILTMSAGLKWDQTGYPYDHPLNSLNRMLNYRGKWLEFVLQLQAPHKPGLQFAYSDGLAMLLGEIIKRSTGMSLMTWTDEKLLLPLGINRRIWRHSIKGSLNSGYGLYLCTRDIAKFGQLFLNGGKWQGLQIIPESWITESTKKHIRLSSNLHYGYMWWQTSYSLANGNRYYAKVASGNYGQFIFIFQDLNEVIVFNMKRPGGEGSSEAKWALVNFILPASVTHNNLLLCSKSNKNYVIHY